MSINPWTSKITGIVAGCMKRLTPIPENAEAVALVMSTMILEEIAAARPGQPSGSLRWWLTTVAWVVSVVAALLVGIWIGRLSATSLTP